MSRRDVAILGGRVILGGYLAAHGAQKLFGSFDGPGIDNTATAFHGMGLRPGRVMATTAGVSEFGGGLLTMLGIAHPIGPVALTGTMAVASTTHRSGGPFAAKRGYELPLTNIAIALVLAAVGPGRYSLDRVLRSQAPGWLTKAAVVGGTAAATAAITMLIRAEAELAAGSGEHQEGDQPAEPAQVAPA